MSAAAPRPRPCAPLELRRRIELTRRVRVGAVYMSAAGPAEVVKRYELGYVMLRDLRTDEWIGLSIDAFRREWWLAWSPP